MYFEKSGQRVFNIKIGNTVVVENLDVFAKTGAKYAAHEEYIEFEDSFRSFYSPRRLLMPADFYSL